MNNLTGLFYSNSKEIIYCVCPNCKSVRKKTNSLFNIIKRGYERNNLARFLCLNCHTWFNEKTGDSLRWQKRF